MSYQQSVISYQLLTAGIILSTW